MTTTNAKTLFVLMAAVAVVASPQEPMKAVFRDPSRPGTVQLRVIRGSITVKGYNGREVLIHTTPRLGGDHDDDHDSDRDRRRSPDTAGLRRIVLPSTGLTVEEENNVMKISVGATRRSTDVVLQVPFRTSLQLHGVHNAGITVENVEGDLEVNNIDGPVTLTNISGSVVAHALNAPLVAILRKVDPAKPMSFSSLNGKIDVTLPADIKATLNLRSGRGEVLSDFDVVIAAKPPKLITEADGEKKGRYRMRTEDSVTAQINGGGQEIAFKNFNGNIYIRKAK